MRVPLLRDTLGTQLGGAGDRTSNLPVTSQGIELATFRLPANPALPPEPHNKHWVGSSPLTNTCSLTACIRVPRKKLLWMKNICLDSKQTKHLHGNRVPDRAGALWAAVASSYSGMLSNGVKHRISGILSRMRRGSLRHHQIYDCWCSAAAIFCYEKDVAMGVLTRLLGHGFDRLWRCGLQSL